MRAAPDYVFEGPAGQIDLWLPSDGMCVTHAWGHFTLTMATNLTKAVDKWALRRGHDLAGFHDWEDMSNYDGATRTMLTAWTLDKRKVMPNIHLLVKSKIVELGVEAANIALGRFLHTYRERLPFEAALQACAKREHVEIVL
jgi:hypothetical protein